MILEYRADSIASILAGADNAEKYWNPDPRAPQELWFRGQSEKRFTLLPGLYRQGSLAFDYDEVDLFERFTARSALFAPPTIRNEWDWYFLAQHHGLPTRLLDWTENLLAATYFAVVGYVESQGKQKYDEALLQHKQPPIYDDESPVIWILDAGTLNVDSLTPEDDFVIAVGGPVTARYLPGNIDKTTNENKSPLAIYPPQASLRIAAQQGVFTIHGHEKLSINELASKNGSGIHLARIVLDRANLHRIWSGLERAGVNRLMLFPDLDSVVSYTKWMCQRSKP